MARHSLDRFTLEVGSATDIGRQRQRNEDSYAVFVPTPGEANPSHLGGMILVADGMGGERAGDRASQLTAERLREWLASGEYRSWPSFSGAAPLETAIEQAVRDVSGEIFRLGEDDAEIRGLGSTVVLVAISGGHAVLAHVGDSRAYLVRDTSLRQLTVDHSWVQRQVDAGVLEPDAARRHPQRNILTRSLGDSLPPDVDVARVDLAEDDRFILCSDGMNGGVSDDEILELALQHRDPQRLAEILLDRANEQDGSDNITVVVGTCRRLDDGVELDMESTDRLELDATLDGSDDAIYEGDTAIFHNPSFYDGDTQPDVLAPSRDQIRGWSDERMWRSWWVAALVALALGLLAGFVIQRSAGEGSITTLSTGSELQAP